MTNTLFLRRAEAGRISQNGLAVKAGLSADRYFRIEKGYAEPTAAERAAIAAALEVAESVIWPELADPSAAPRRRATDTTAADPAA